MNFKEFKFATKRILNHYFKSITDLKERGSLNSFGGTILFPNFALFIETCDHYAFELLGGQPYFDGLTSKDHKAYSISEHLYQFSTVAKAEPLFLLNGKGTGLIQLKISSKIDEEMVQQRFPFLDTDPCSHLIGTNLQGSAIAFGPNFSSCFLDNCLLINRCNDVYRLKQILHLRVVTKRQSSNRYISEFQEDLKKSQQVLGVMTSHQRETELLAGQFSTIFLTPGLHETTIGEFVSQNLMDILIFVI
jgi:hypothetical protein